MEIDKLLSDSIIQHVFTGKDSYGDKIFSDITVPHKCVSDGRITKVKDSFGQLVTASKHFYIIGVVPFSYEDEVTFEGERYPVVSWLNYDGFKNRPGLTVVYINGSRRTR